MRYGHAGAGDAVGNVIDRISFTVPGNPIPKARPRVTFQPGRKPTAYTPARTKGWEATVADVARLAMGGREPVEGPVELTLRFYRRDRRRVDGDNMTKAVFDALQGRVFENDDQVVACHWYKRVDRDRPRVEVVVGEVGE